VQWFAQWGNLVSSRNPCFVGFCILFDERLQCRIFVNGISFFFSCCFLMIWFSLFCIKIKYGLILNIIMQRSKLVFTAHFENLFELFPQLVMLKSMI
jgi:hypothetical protein